MHLLPSAPPQLVTAAHRTLALLYHPDTGGTHEAAVEINRAVEILREDQNARSC